MAEPNSTRDWFKIFAPLAWGTIVALVALSWNSQNDRLDDLSGRFNAFITGDEGRMKSLSDSISSLRVEQSAIKTELGHHNIRLKELGDDQDDVRNYLHDVVSGKGAKLKPSSKVTLPKSNDFGDVIAGPNADTGG